MFLLFNRSKNFLSIYRAVLFLCSIIFFVSCGRDKAEKIDDAIVEAKFYLTKSECQKAINALEAVGRQNFNPQYLQTLSSAYACRAGFGEINFFANDIPLIGTTGGEFFNSLAKFSTSSSMIAPTSGSFVDLQSAIDILLYAGGLTTPSATGRATYFIKKDRDNINVQALYMIVAQLGKYTRYYGNASSTGAKGTGTYGNNCYVSYTNVTAQACAAALATDACTAAYVGHPQMSGADFKKRMCQSVVLLNNLADILVAVTLSTGSSIGNLGTILSTVQTNYNSVCSLYPTICALRSQTDCEATSQDNLEIFMACVMETLHD